MKYLNFSGAWLLLFLIYTHAPNLRHDTELLYEPLTHTRELHSCSSPGVPLHKACLHNPITLASSLFQGHSPRISCLGTTSLDLLPYSVLPRANIYPLWTFPGPTYNHGLNPHGWGALSLKLTNFTANLPLCGSQRFCDKWGYFYLGSPTQSRNHYTHQKCSLENSPLPEQGNHMEAGKN